jgi:glycosyltransferase involved in cell wall biosynthesis
VIVELFKRKDKRVYLIRCLKNKGYSHAKNVGIIQATGEFIVHLDADDMLCPGSLKTRLQAFENNPKLDMVCANAYKFKGNKSLEWCDANKINLEITSKMCHAQTIMIRKAVYKKYGLYYEKLRSKADKEMWYRIGVHPKSPFKAAINCEKLNVPVAYYRRHSDAMAIMRTQNKAYDDKIERKFKKRMQQLKKEGINMTNTRFI